MRAPAIFCLLVCDKLLNVPGPVLFTCKNEDLAAYLARLLWSFTNMMSAKFLDRMSHSVTVLSKY